MAIEIQKTSDVEQGTIPENAVTGADALARLAGGTNSLAGLTGGAAPQVIANWAAQDGFAMGQKRHPAPAPQSPVMQFLTPEGPAP